LRGCSHSPRPAKTQCAPPTHLRHQAPHAGRNRRCNGLSPQLGSHLPLPGFALPYVSGLGGASTSEQIHRWSGLITQKTADDLQLSSGVVTWVYPGVSETQLRALAETPGALAFDPRWMIAYEPPAVRTEPPVTLFIGFSAGLLASLLVAYYSSAITRNLRPTLAALQSVGVRPTWLTIVTMVQVGVVILTAVLFAWLGAIVATLLSTQTWITNAQLHIPWASVGVLLATLVVGALVSQLFSMRRLGYSER